MAETVQYESAREPARQMNVHDLPPEPFTLKQQRQTRMDGGEDEDGSLREFVEVGPPVVQPYREREEDRAAAQNRAPLTGASAYRDLPLTGALQSTFPCYRQSFSFATLAGTTQPTIGDVPYRSDADLFKVDEEGKVVATLLPDGTEASKEDLESDATAWASHFGRDNFNNHCTNHEHNCTETCVKYVKQKQEAKLSLRSTKVPSCRFWYLRVKKINNKRVRRRGKPLVCTPYVENSNCRNQEYRCQLKRETPLRSTSNDVCQVTVRCNVDFQFLVCAPPETAFENDAPQLVPDSVAPISKRLTKKTKGITTPTLAMSHGKRGIKWLYGCGAIKFDSKLLLNFSEAFRKAYGMDFYITKYQGKMMESLTPLFQTMTTGIQRLEQQEKDEAEKAQAQLQEGSAQGEAKKRRTQADDAARARRVCIRLASMANRCYWLSTTEVTTHILTGGDALQSHRNARVFTRQLQWAMQECKRVLNNEAPLEDVEVGQQTIQTATLQLQAANEAEGDVAQPAQDDVEVTAMDVCTTSTNTADDFAHRGVQLQTMPYYVYRMYVLRVRKQGGSQANAPCFFQFEEHYPLANSYIQELKTLSMEVPTIDGFQCPTWEQDPEQNSLLKSLLFTPWACRDPMTCGDCCTFQHMLSNCSCSSVRGASQPVEPSSRKYTFERAWRLRCSEIHVLAARADTRCHAGRKHLVLADTTLLATLKEPLGAIKEGEELKSMLCQYTKNVLQRTMPFNATRTILAFSGCMCSWHDEQCTLAEFCAYIARDVISHIELAAEAKSRGLYQQILRMRWMRMQTAM